MLLIKQKLVSFFVLTLAVFFAVSVAAKSYVEKKIFLPHGCSYPSHLIIFSTNDHHGSIAGKKNMAGQTEGGLARQKTFMDEQISRDNQEFKCPVHLVVSAGDVMSGDIVSDLEDNAPDFAAMNDIGFNAMVLGNHDFDRGSAVIGKLMRDVIKFPVLGANIYDSKKRVYPYTRYVVFRILGGVDKEQREYKVVLIGVTTEGVDFTSGDKGRFVVQNPTVTVNELLSEIQRKHHPDAVGVLAHLGGAADDQYKGKTSSDNLARLTNGRVDFVVDGHDHVLLKKPVVVDSDSYRTLIIEAGSDSLYVSMLRYMLADGKRVNDSAHDYDVKKIDANILEDPSITEILNRYALDPNVKPYWEVILDNNPVYFEGNRDVLKSHPTNLSRLVTDAYNYCGGSTDISFLRPSSIRNSIYRGRVTAGDIANVSPFLNENNTLVKAKLTPSQAAALSQLVVEKENKNKVPFMYFSDSSCTTPKKAVKFKGACTATGIKYDFETTLNNQFSHEPVLTKEGKPYFAYDCLVDYVRHLKGIKGEPYIYRKYRTCPGQQGIKTEVE